VGVTEPQIFNHGLRGKHGLAETEPISPYWISKLQRVKNTYM